MLLTFIQAATGEVVSAEELGGAMMHSRSVNKNLVLDCYHFFHWKTNAVRKSMQLLDNFFSVETTQVLFLLANWEKNYFWLWGQSHPSFCNRVTSAKISISWILKEHKQIYTLYFFQIVLLGCSQYKFYSIPPALPPLY